MLAKLSSVLPSDDGYLGRTSKDLSGVMRRATGSCVHIGVLVKFTRLEYILMEMVLNRFMSFNRGQHDHSGIIELSLTGQAGVVE